MIVSRVKRDIQKTLGTICGVTLMLVLFKLFDLVEWSWFWVFFPLWLLPTIWIVTFVIAVFYYAGKAGRDE